MKVYLDGDLVNYITNYIENIQKWFYKTIFLKSSSGTDESSPAVLDRRLEDFQPPRK